MGIYNEDIAHVCEMHGKDADCEHPRKESYMHSLVKPRPEASSLRMRKSINTFHVKCIVLVLADAGRVPLWPLISRA